LSVAAAHDAISLELPGGTVRVLLFAGGTTGLVLLAGSEEARGFCAGLGEAAEEAGLSALAFADAIPGDATLAADRAGELLGRLGVESTVLVAVGDEAVAALRAAATSAFAAVVLVEPRIPDGEIEALLADVPAAKLVLVRGNDAEAQAAAAAVYRHAIGPVVVQHLVGGEALAGETAAMITEATITFAVGVCGDGRRA
jgi:hypothetical protein